MHTETQTDFESLQIRVIPKNGEAENLWLPSPETTSRSKLLEMPAYAEAETRIGRCGAVTLADASVSVPFVGVATIALLIGQLILIASLMEPISFIQAELGALEMTTFGPILHRARSRLEVFRCARTESFDHKSRCFAVGRQIRQGEATHWTAQRQHMAFIGHPILAAAIPPDPNFNDF